MHLAYEEATILQESHLPRDSPKPLQLHTFKERIMFRILTVSFVLLCFLPGLPAAAQVNIPSTVAVTENFDAMASGTALPANWKMSAAGITANWTTGTNVTAVNATACAPSPTAGARYNWGTTACTDRAIGFMTSGSYASPNSILAHYRNTSGSTFANITVSFDIERYRVNTTAFSLTFFTSTDGTTWTAQTAGDVASTVFATGTSAYTFGTPASTTRTVNITGINVPNNGDFYVRWIFSTGGSNSQGMGLDNVSLTGDPGTVCTSDPEPTAAAAGLSYSNIDCSSMTLTWTNGNGAKRLVVARAGAAVAGTPTDQQAYAANAAFGTGSTIAANEYVVYNGNGNTVTITGLSVSTTYHFKIFEYNGTGCPSNGENYFLTSLTGSQGTPACIYPQITGVLINACSGSCSEGDNEIIFMNSGSYSIPVSPANIIVKYDNVSPAAVTFTDAFTTNAAFINTMNTTAGCGTLFFDAMAVGTIPDSTIFMVMRNTACYGYDFAAFCGYGPVYVLFSTDASWTTSGNFSNSCTTTRYFRSDFSATCGAGSVIDYSWDPCLLTSNGDGDAISFPQGGGAANSYFNNGCTPPVTILPIELLSFEAVRNGDNVKLEWVTASESNNSFFTIERTIDGLEYENITMVQGAGNSTSAIHYSAIDPAPYRGLSYYRLKQTDYDGKHSWSSLVPVHYSEEGDLWVTYNSQAQSFDVVLSSEEDSKTSIRIIDAMGKIIYFSDAAHTNDLHSISTSGLPKGIYFVQAITGSTVLTSKILLY